VVFIKDSISIGNDFEMHLSKTMVAVVDESSKSHCLGKDENIKGIEEAKEQVEDVQIVNKKGSFKIV